MRILFTTGYEEMTKDPFVLDADPGEPTARECLR